MTDWLEPLVADNSDQSLAQIPCVIGAPELIKMGIQIIGKFW